MVSLLAKNKIRWPLIIAVLVSAVVGVTIFTIRGWAVREELPTLSPDSPLLIEVQRGPMVVEIEQKGGLQAVQSTRIFPEIKGEAKITGLVKEGAWVEEGDVLVELDGTEIEKELSELNIDFQTAEGNVLIAEENLRLQELTNGANLLQAEIDARFADKDLAKYLNGDAILEKQRLELELETALIGLEQAKEKYNRMPGLRERGFVTPFEVREAEIALMEAESALEAAKHQLDVWNRLTFPKTKSEMEAALDSNRALLVRMKEEHQNMLATRQNQLETAQKNRDKLAEQIADLESQLEGMVINAPGPGLVVYGDENEGRRRRRRGNEEELQVGGTAYPGRAIMRLPNLKEMMMVASVDERFINQIEEVQPAEIFVNALPGHRFTGKIGKIGSIASGGGPGEIKEYDVEIPLDEQPKTPLLPGMNATATIRIAERENALFIPKEAVHTRKGGPQPTKVVYTHEGNDLRAVEVETGIMSEHFVEILSGLEEGGKVFLGQPPANDEQQDGASAEAGPAPEAG